MDKELLDQLIAILPGHVYWLNRENIFLGCNDLQAKVSGFNSRHDIVGKTMYDIAEKDRAERLIANNNIVMESGEEKTFEEYALDESKNKTTWLSNKVPIKDKHDEVIGILGISFNITGIKTTEKELKLEKKLIESNMRNHANFLERINKEVTGQIYRQKPTPQEYVAEIRDYLESIISLVPGHVYWKDKSGKYLGCNESQARSLGLASRKDIVGKTDYDFVWQDSKQTSELLKMDQMVIQSGVMQENEETVILANGVEATFLSQKEPLRNKDKEIIGVLGISIDISDRKKAEKALLEAKVLHERVTNMRLYGASIAHELRTPLRSIESGFHGVHKKLDKLIDGYKQAQNAKLPVQFLAKTEIESLDEVLDVINDEMRSAFVIVEMMLARSKTANINPEALEAISMVDCINNALKRYPFQEGEREKIHLQIENDFEFLGEIPLATHILFNLIKNSLYFTRVARKGEIYIRLERGGANNRLYFKDTGSGIPEDIVSKIFQPFFTTTEFGTGAGLAFCQQVMHGFGGEIACLSHFGKYVEFILTFSADIDACRQSLTQKSGKCLQ